MRLLKNVKSINNTSINGFLLLRTILEFIYCAIIVQLTFPTFASKVKDSFLSFNGMLIKNANRWQCVEIAGDPIIPLLTDCSHVFPNQECPLNCIVCLEAGGSRRRIKIG